MISRNTLALGIALLVGQAHAATVDSVVAIQQADISKLKQLIQVPVGGIVPIAANLEGSWQPPAPGVVKDGFMLCDGSQIPAGNTLKGPTPALTDSRFLMGSTVAGQRGGQDKLPDHTHDFSLKVGTAWSGTVTGTVGNTEISVNRDSGGVLSKTQGNLGLPTLDGASFAQLVLLAGSSHNHTWSGTVSGSLNNGAVSGSVGSGSKATETTLQPKYSTVVYVIRVK